MDIRDGRAEVLSEARDLTAGPFEIFIQLLAIKFPPVRRS
jgi:hypothetical protein